MPESPAVPDDAAGLRAANARLRELLSERDARIWEQAAEIAALRELVTALQSQVADLAAQGKTNSRNSSKPPSSDGPAKPSPKSLRGKSGRKPGKPKGQPGPRWSCRTTRTRRCGTGRASAARCGNP